MALIRDGSRVIDFFTSCCIEYPRDVVNEADWSKYDDPLADWLTLTSLFAAAIPIGAYEPAWFVKDNHCGPDEAVTIHQELGAKRSLAVHWVRHTHTSETTCIPRFIWPMTCRV